MDVAAKNLDSNDRYNHDDDNDDHDDDNDDYDDVEDDDFNLILNASFFSLNISFSFTTQFKISNLNSLS